MFILYLLSYLFFSTEVRTAPISSFTTKLDDVPLSNITFLNTEIAPLWVITPGIRGTINILSSCLVTLSLCIYTAIHPNIPSKFWTKVKWACIALLAPEIVLYTAWFQFWEAKRLVKGLNDICLKSSNHVKSPKPLQFSLLFGYFAVMGGLAVDVNDMHNVLERITLTPDGILYLARIGYLDQIRVPDDTIRDKSKANTFVKLYSCWQALWMLIQCIARKASHYPLTLLEIHTLVHVVCALSMYCFWWAKPLDINDPIIINSTSFQESLALMLMCQAGSIHHSNWKLPSDIHHSNWKLLRDMDSDYISSLGEASLVNIVDEIGSEVQPTTSLEDPKDSKGNYFSLPNPKRTLRTGQCLSGGIGPADSYNLQPWTWRQRKTWKRQLKDLQLINPNNSIRVDLSEKYITRWNLAAKAYRESEQLTVAVENSENSDSDSAQSTQWPPKVESLFLEDSITWSTRSVNFPWNAESVMVPFGMLLDITAAQYIVPILFILTSIYGGVHLTAWTFDFPSSVIFQAIGIYIFSPSSGFFINVFKYNCYLGYLVLPFYILFRLFLVIESFVSLRHVPIGVYAGIPWVNYIPHI
ncbi:MAG: hypothetical protein M1834_007532 [Cirrosporium novae-zelandiae]|nr:MAG: hypothetical protein M1834_007532 [Cirrosporium novae-zelandiae]